MNRVEATYHKNRIRIFRTRTTDYETQNTKNHSRKTGSQPTFNLTLPAPVLRSPTLSVKKPITVNQARFLRLTVICGHGGLHAIAIGTLCTSKRYYIIPLSVTADVRVMISNGFDFPPLLCRISLVQALRLDRKRASDQCQPVFTDHSRK